MCAVTLFGWLRRNILTVILLVVIAYLLFRSSPIRPLSRSVSYLSNQADYGESASLKVAPTAGVGGMAGIMPEAPLSGEVKNRLVVQNSHLSLKVSNVTENISKIKSQAEGFGGYMVDSSVSKPEETTSGNITVRLPAGKLDEFLSFCRGLAVKVVSENIRGTDVTDQYVDTAKRIETLEKTKRKFEEMLDKAANVQDILQVQREIINLQEQIDSLKGQNQYLEQTAKMAKITVYLASDELDLPYAPSESWRPAVIFKTAVRSLVGTVRKLGTLLIWLAVFSMVWGPILIVYLILKRRKRN